MSDSSAIVSALIAKLGADTTLLALMPNGVYEDVAPDGMTRFVIVSQVASLDVTVFEGRAYEEATFLVEARALSTSGGDVRAAAVEIDLLLDPQPPLPPATLTIPGYDLMGIEREEFVRSRERDEVDLSLLWIRRGGRYRVQAALLT